MERRYNIEELCRMAGVKRRTVHFYVQEKLLPPPAGRGMGGFYGQRHVELLVEILRLRKEGRSLRAIGDILRSGAGSDVGQRSALEAEGHARVLPSFGFPADPATEECVRYRIALGVEVLVDRSVHESAPEKVRQLCVAAREIFTNGGER